jgi:acyl-coenzyme A thioesterase PaaI-like protein
MSAVLDEAMGAAAWIAGHPVVAARLTVHFRQMMPLEQEIRIEAWVAEKNGKKVVVLGRLSDAAGRVFCESEGLFIELGIDAFHKLADKLV